MTRLTRRDFLKLTGLGTAGLASLYGLGASRRAVQHLLSGFVQAHLPPTAIATACPGCPAGCGCIVHTVGGRVASIAGNPAHPVSFELVCPAGQYSIQALHSPDRVKGPLQRSGRGSGVFEPLGWEAAVLVLKRSFQKYRPGEMAFLLGLYPDHLYDLVRTLSAGLGGPQVLRYDLSAELDGRVALADAARQLFGVPKIPYFDLGAAQIIFSFGASFREAWLAPGAFQRGSAGRGDRRSYLVQFESYRSQVAVQADEWIPIQPGSEGILAQALLHLVAEAPDKKVPPPLAGFDLQRAALLSGVPLSELRRLADLFASASPGLAVPGGAALGGLQGLAAGQAILSLNVLADNLGKVGGLFLSPGPSGFGESPGRPATLAELGALAERIRSGAIKALFVHGFDPLDELPKSFEFAEALDRLELLISFSPLLGRTAAQAGYIFPDHLPLESWGYQRVGAASDRPAISAIQPAIHPLYNTRSTVEVLLQAVQATGGRLAQAVAYTDEWDFLRQSLVAQLSQAGFRPASEAVDFWGRWRQQGGWWAAKPALVPAVSILPITSLGGNLRPSVNSGATQEDLLPDEMSGFPGKQKAAGLLPLVPLWYEGGDLRAEIHPQTAASLGVRSGETVEVASSVGKLIAVLYENEAMLPGVVAVPSGITPPGVSHPMQDSGTSLLDLLECKENESGSLAFTATCVSLTRTPVLPPQSPHGLPGPRPS